METLLPEGLQARPPTIDDVEAVVAVIRADQLAHDGEAFTTAGDIRSDWNRPSFDLPASAVVVHDADQVVGYAEATDGRATIAVAPSHAGRGIGTWLREWTEARSRDQGHPRVGQTIADVDDDATAILREAGYAPRWASWVFSIPLTATQPVPDHVRPMARPAEDEVVHRVVEDAFSEWPDRDTGTSFEDWRAANLDRDDVEVLVVEVDGAVVGAAVCLDEGEGEGWVEQLAVTASHRGQGLARALLQAAFARFAERGCTTAGLSTDSRTGAKALYEHVGMTVASSYTRWSRELG